MVIYIHTSSCMDTHARTHTHTHTHAHTQTPTHTHTHTNTPTQTHTHTNTHPHTPTPTQTHTHTHTHTHTSSCLHKHAHAHIALYNDHEAWMHNFYAHSNIESICAEYIQMWTQHNSVNPYDSTYILTKCMHSNLVCLWFRKSRVKSAVDSRPRFQTVFR